MGSESRLELGRVLGAMPAIASLTGGGAHDWMDNRIRAVNWLIRVCNISQSG